MVIKISSGDKFCSGIWLVIFSKMLNAIKFLRSVPGIEPELSFRQLHSHSPDILVIFAMSQWCSAGNEFKMPVEIRKIVKPAFITNFCNRFICIGEEFAGMPHAHFDKEIGEGFFNPRFE